MKAFIANVLLAIAVTADFGAVPTSVQLNLADAIARSSRSYVSANFDWHKPQEPGWEHNASVMTVDFSNPLLRAAAAALAPGRLRVGGSQQDLVVYDVAGNGCADHSDLDNAFCLSMTRWSELVEFCESTGLQLVFGLNARAGAAANRSTPLNFTNIDAFLSYTAKAKLPVHGFELGNELPNIPAAVAAADFKTLRALIDQHWTDDSLQKPCVIGNDLNPDPAYVAEFLVHVGSSLDVLTYHNYVAEGGSIPLSNFLTPAYLDKGPQEAQGVYEAFERHAAPGTEIWVGEIAACWHSGQQHVTDRFMDSFWYADALAARAARNHTGFCRQAFVGGYYELLDMQTYAPNPDFYVARIFHNLMGPTVLRAVARGAPSTFRVYSQCTPNTDADVTTLLINLDPYVAVDVKINATYESRDEFHLSSDSLTSKQLLLNGQVLVVEDNVLPDTSAGAHRVPTDALVVMPHTIAFVRLRGVDGANACVEAAKL